MAIRDVTLEPGAKVAKEVSFSVAKLAVTAKDSKGEPLSVYLEVFKDGEEEKRLSGDWTGTKEPRYVDLVPGKYHLKVKEEKSKQETAIRDVTLEPGAKVVKEVSFSVAKLAVTAKDAKGEPLSVYLEVFKDGEEEKRLSGEWTGTKEPRYVDLVPGKYHLKVKEQKSKQEMAIRDVTLEPGAKVVKEVSF